MATMKMDQIPKAWKWTGVPNIWLWSFSKSNLWPAECIKYSIGSIFTQPHARCTTGKNPGHRWPQPVFDFYRSGSVWNI